MWLRTLSWPEFRQHPWRSLTAVLAITLGVALALAVQLINASALAEFGQAVRTAQAQADLVLHSRQGPLPDTVMAHLVQHPLVQLANPVLDAPLRLQAEGGPPITVRLLGVDMLAVGRMAPDLQPRATRADAAPTEPATSATAQATRPGWQDWFAPDTVYLNDAARRALNLPAQATQLRALPHTLQAATPPQPTGTAGPSVAISASSPASVPLRVAGEIAAVGAPTAVMDIAAAQLLLGQRGVLTRIDLQLNESLSPAEAERRLGLPATLGLSRPQDATERTAQLTRAYRVNLSVMALVALFTGAFLVYSVLALSVAQRAPQLALLGVLGMSPRERMRLVVGESLLLGACGAVLGVALGTGLAWGAMHVLGGDLGGGYFSSQVPPLQWSWPAAVADALLGVLAAVLGGWIPARQAAALAPAQTLKGTGVDAGTPLPMALGLGLMALAGALALLPPVAGVPVAAYAAVGVLLLGGMALLPHAVALVYNGLAPRLNRWPLPLLAVERARRLRGLAAVAVSGVVAALALATALTVMVASFRQSMLDWLDTVLPADLYLRMPQATTQTSVPLPAGLQAALADTPGVLRVSPQRMQSWLPDPRQPALTLIWRELHAPGADASRPSLPLIQTPSAAPPNTLAVYISEGVQLQWGLQQGQTWPALTQHLAMLAQTPSPPVPLQADRSVPPKASDVSGTASDAGATPVNPASPALTGAPTVPTPAATAPVYIAGIYRDYARAAGSISLDWAARPPHAPATELALWLTPATAGDHAATAAANDALQARIARVAGTGDAPELHSTQALRARSMRIFDRSFAVTYWLQAIAIGIGLFGVSASFSAQALARRKEFGLLIHLGLTRVQVRRMVALEGLAWCTVGALAGLALGLGVAQVLIRVVNPQSFHWRMDVHVPWLRLAALGLAVVAAGTLTAYLTARRLAAQDAVRAVKEDW